MSKEEFLRGLERALQGEVPAAVIRENLHYYSQYISEESGRGTPEREVLEAIGDPRLIARTIIDSTAAVEHTGQGSWSSRDSAYDEQGVPSYENTGRKSDSIHYYDLNKWYWKLLLGVIVVGVLFLVLTIVGGIFRLLLPLLPVIIIIYVIMAFTRGRR